MAARMQKQQSNGRRSPRNSHSRRISIIIISSILILLSIGLLILWILNQIGIIQKPWSALLSSVFGTISTIVAAIFTIVSAVIIASHRQLFPKLFSNASDKKDATSQDETSEPSSHPTVSITNTLAVIQNDRESVPDGRKERVDHLPSPQLEFRMLTQKAAIKIPSNSIFLFNEHLPVPIEFYGRKRERETLISRCRIGASTSIVGPRRIGKTWLIEYLLQVAPTQLGHDYRIGYLDATLPRSKTMSGFIAVALEKLGIGWFPSDIYLDLKAFEDAVNKMKTKNIIPILCIDEFEGLNDQQEFDLSFFTGLRAISQVGLGLVIASKTTLFDIVGEDGHTSGFFNIFDTHILKPFDAKEAKLFVQAKIEQAQWTEQEQNYILKYSQQQDQQRWPPLRLQLAGKMLLEDKEGGYFQPSSVDYWVDFKDRLEKKYNAVGL